MISTRKRRPWIRTSGNKLLPHPLLFDHAPRPCRRLAPVRSFRVVSELAELESIHEGRGLSLDDVIREVTAHFAFIDDGEPGEPVDLTVYSERRVVAIIHKIGDGKGGYLVVRPFDQST